MAEAERLCGRITVLAEGRVAVQGTPAELCRRVAAEHGQPPTLESVFLTWTGRSLDDADEALKLMPINLDVRETRGFIFLKLNEPAQALVNYDAALALDPNRPLALYGRGLARLRMGDAGGKGDEDAAMTIDPEVAGEFTRYGVQ